MKSFRPYASHPAVIVLVAAGLAMFSLAFLSGDDVHDAVWISSGYLAGCLIRLPWRKWIPVVLGILALGWAHFWLFDVVSGRLVVIGNIQIAGLMAGAALYRVTKGSRTGLRDLSDVGKLGLLVIVLPAVLTASMDWVLDPAHRSGATMAEHAWPLFLVQVVSISLLTPLTLHQGRIRAMLTSAFRHAHPMELAIYLSAPILLLCMMMATGFRAEGAPLMLGYGILLAALGTTLRFGMAGTMIATAFLGSLYSVAIHQEWIQVVRTEQIAGFALETEETLLAAALFVTWLLAVALEQLRNQEQISAASARRYRSLFHTAPVGLWELDMSSVKRWLDEQILETEDAVRAFLISNIDVVRRMMAAGVVDVNKPILDLFQVSSIAEVKNLVPIELDKYRDDDLAHIVGINYARKGPVHLELHRTLPDGVTEVSLLTTYLVTSGSENDWARWLVSNVDITALRKTEDHLDAAEVEAERLSRMLLDAEKVGKTGSWIRDIASGNVTWSPGMYALYEMDPEAGMTVEERLARVHPADADWLRRTEEHGMLDHHLQFRLLMPGGRIKWIESVGKVDGQDGGGAPILRGLQRDITDLMTASIEKSEVVDILETTSAVAYTVEGFDRERPMYLSPGIGQYFFDREALLRNPGLLFRYAREEDAREIRNMLSTLSPDSGHIPLEYELETPVGRVWFRDYVRRRSGNDEVPVFEGVLIDISGEKEAIRLQALEADRTRVLLRLPELASDLEGSDFIVAALAEAEALTGSQVSFFHFINPDEQSIHLTAWSKRTSEVFCHAAFDDHYPVSDAGIWADALRERRTIIINDYASHPGKMGLPEGHSPLTRLIAQPVFDEGRIVAICGVGNADEDYSEEDVRSLALVANEVSRLSIGARRREQERLEQARLQTFFDTVYDSFVIYKAVDGGATFLVTYLNQAAVETGGVAREDALNRDVRTVWPGVEESGVLAIIRKTWETGEPHYEREVHYEYEDVDQWFEMSVVRLPDDSVAVAYRDISEIIEARHEAVRLEHQLAASQRMEALGRLAGGVAHDFNNLLSVILGNAEAGQVSVSDPERSERHFKQIESTALRSADLTKQLLGFARRQIGEAQRVDVFAYLQELSEMLKRLIGENIEFRVRTGPAGTVFMQTDPSFIDQIVTNLCVNARDAIIGSGTITLSADVVLRREVTMDWPLECNQESYICVSVVDTGIGMDTEMQKHVFEPFFSTKEFGTGLGLSTVYGIIKQLNGCVDLTSEPGAGTTFRVFLPTEEAQGKLVNDPAPQD